MSISVHYGDLPDGLDFGPTVAVDTETMGLKPHRDRLCLVQLSSGDGTAHLVKFNHDSSYDAPNLKALMGDSTVTKLFHFARFDLAVLYHALGVMPTPAYCTKIASKLTRTYTDRHGLKDLCRELLSVDISKAQQSSDWGADDLSDAQQAYAASDVLYLHRLKEALDPVLQRENRQHIAQAAFEFLPIRAELDLMAGEDYDLFAHS
ncbi:3'-5' exonuclease [Iodidimonas gelatinilytica]|uniref:3'-5' exonuclease n=1 Tax=Iodidimonas gelatinilytica TaxID=1236966 RepID=A0A5A7MUZ8_9PROT|nr:ribonuclease H-like domain-containing protein [Iodidimonas gelatinilytica]GEQ99143.1 3'-5' exonuclease [Iodidimonas gelatinilytica]